MLPNKLISDSPITTKGFQDSKGSDVEMYR